MLRAACATCTRVHGTRVDEQAETEGYHISFIDFFKVGFPVMLISVAVANVYLFMLNALFWQSTAGEGGGLRTNAELAAL
jgi:hypothetical protein